jgi:AraC-like DNA-binding protein
MTVIQLTIISFFLLIHNKKNYTSNYFLAFVLLIQAILTANLFASTIKDYLIAFYPVLLIIASPIIFLPGPSLYFYTKSIVYKNFRLKKQDIIHFLPFLIYCLYIFSKFFNLSPEQLRNILTVKIGLTEYIIRTSIIQLLILSYVIASLKIIGYYQKEIKKTLSSIEKINLSWLRLILFGYIGMWVFWISTYILYATTNKFHNNLHFTGMFLLFVLVNIIFYKGMRQPEFFAGIEEKPKYETSTLTKDEKENYHNKLINYMEKEKPFLNSSLSLNDLSDKLAIMPKYLSQVINECCGKNFYDFVNGYRVEEAKKILLSPSGERKTILEILFEVGFNSKSTFNTAFKNFTGVKPTEFKKMSY